MIMPVMLFFFAVLVFVVLVVFFAMIAFPLIAGQRANHTAKHICCG
jgi:hypothetical protein